MVTLKMHAGPSVPAAALPAPYACCDETSRGRRYPEAPPRYRSQFQRDRDRIIHSAAFRRLEYKTQVFVNHEGDLFRTRLTHTVEVSQIARSIARTLHLNEDLAEAIALAHDLGHPPFGHAGQDILDECMRQYGGFEHNLQSLRVVDELEERYAEFTGLNLTYETREGILKHCRRDQAVTLGELGERFLTGSQPGLEAQLVNLADEIAYVCHDLDDGLRAAMISVETLAELELFQEAYVGVVRRYPGLAERRIIHETVRSMVGRLIDDVIDTSRAALEAAAPADTEAVRGWGEPLIAHSPVVRGQVARLKAYLARNLYRHYRVQRMTTKARRVVAGLFEAFVGEPLLLPTGEQERVRALERETGSRGRARGVTDYIAGMTDRYAALEYQRLFDPLERA